MKTTKIISLILFVGLLYPSGCKEKSKSDKETSSTAISLKDYEEIGLKYANTTQAELGKNLMGAIQKEGTLGALEFCNIQAYPLTDSMAVVHHARIKRVSDKPRNPMNKANAEELGYIEDFKQDVASGSKIDPIVKTEGRQVHFYSPIVTNTMCLQCHGMPGEQVKPVTMAKLQELYPSDMAIGYNENEVRGIWAIVFDQKATE
ncbi:DUF3365 domain-containing protein [Flavobacteriaceae bacterium F89]|uniref:DUF3365 domain-containing protein n=1 Tax=Cerina litoralis TaxID=2874477 RepID=A0AAE3EUS2_9FLAO|nr:DUF3365 domain-containing protein [Cerina litoralis]MCG2460027.1 DUF3365 domain-containing protein [Cerina litoralis]